MHPPIPVLVGSSLAAELEGHMRDDQFSVRIAGEGRTVEPIGTITIKAEQQAAVVEFLSKY